MEPVFNKNKNEALKRIRELIAHPAPRTVPKDIIRHSLNPFLFIVFLTGLIFLIFPICLFFLRINSDTPIVPIIFLLSVCLIGWVIFSIFKAKTILIWGQLIEGEIIGVRIHRVEMKDMFRKTLYFIKVRFNDIGGKERSATRIVDKSVFQRFYGEVAVGKETELIYSPKRPSSILLPIEIAVRTCLK